MRGDAIGIGLVLALEAASWSVGSPQVPGGDESRRSTVALYDAGEYAEACPAIESLVDAGKPLDGPMTYRLFFCRRQRGDARAAETLSLARTRLEQELPESADLDVPFYLVNALQNLEESAEARRVAEKTLASLKSGTLRGPETPAERFRLAKLHADLGLDPEATSLYAEALAGFEVVGRATFRPYVLWASRWIGERALDRQDWPAVDRAFSALAQSNDASVYELDRLAVARSRLGRFAEAREAWDRAVKAEPATTDRARYCARIAELAAELAPLPQTDPTSERRLGDLSKDELEALLNDQAEAVRNVRREAAATKRLKKKARQQLESRMATAKSMFVAAAYEYALDDFPIRETLFQAGLAQLLFWPQEWQVVPTPPE